MTKTARETTWDAELRTHNEYDSLLTKVLMEQHPEWSMEVVREAALICSNTLIPAVQQEIAKAMIDGAGSYKNSLQNEMVDHQDNLVGFKEMDSWFEQYKLSQTLKEHKEA